MHSHTRPYSPRTYEQIFTFGFNDMVEYHAVNLNVDLPPQRDIAYDK